MSLREVISSIKKFNSFIIATHINPEPDALGSVLSLSYLLKKLDKKSVVVLNQPIPQNCRFLVEGINDIKIIYKFPSQHFDCLVVLDASDLGRLGQISRTIPKDIFIINIDHHISNSRFANINWVEPKSSSCVELVYKLYKRLKVSLDKNSSFLIYAGIISDTGSFRYENTNYSTHKVVAELLRYPLNVHQIYKLIFGNFTFREAKVLIKILSQIEVRGKIAYLIIERKFFRIIPSHLIEYLLDFLRNIRGVELAVLFKPDLERKGYIRVNLRSEGKFDVNEIASFFGGGGHFCASGFSIKASMRKAKEKVLHKIKRIIKNADSLRNK